MLGAGRRRAGTPIPPRGIVPAVAVEGLLAGAVLVALALALWRFHLSGYLPQPFLYDLNYPLMGLYDTAYWANNPRTYEIGKNIYPPLSFVFLRLISIHDCYGRSAFAGRECDWLVRWVILGVFALNAGLVWRRFRQMDPATALPRAIALSFGLPMLYGLECMNLIIVAFTFFAFGFGPAPPSGEPRSGLTRWLALGLAINFKPYLLVSTFPALLRRDWRWLGGCVVASGAIYGLTYALQGGGSPAELIGNLTLYAADITHKTWSDFYYGTSYWPLIRFMSAQFRLMGFASAHGGDLWGLALVVRIRGAQIGAAACLIAGVFRPSGVNTHRLAAMIVAVVLTTVATGQSGYVQIFLFFLIFLEPWRGWLRITVLACAYLLCIPADLALTPVIHAPAWSWLGGRPVIADFGVSAGQLIRPALLLVIQYGLIAINLQDILGAPGREAGRVAAVAPAPPQPIRRRSVRSFEP